jgi:hypothetical protein
MASTCKTDCSTSMSMLWSLFLMTCRASSTGTPGLKWLNSCVNLTGVVQWLRLALPKGPNWVGVFSPLHLRPEDRNRSSFQNVMFLFSRIPDNGKRPKSQ